VENNAKLNDCKCGNKASNLAVSQRGSELKLSCYKCGRSVSGVIARGRYKSSVLSIIQEWNEGIAEPEEMQDAIRLLLGSGN